MSGAGGAPAPVRGPTLLRRLRSALGARLLIAWAVTTLAVGVAVVHDVDELYDASLLAVADAVVALDAAPPTVDPGWRAVPLGPSPGSFIDYRVRERAAGATADVAASADRATAPIDGAAIEARDGERVLRLTLGPREPGAAPRTVEIAQGLSERRFAILDLLLTMLLPALLIVPVGVLGLRATLERELAPLDALAAEIDRRGGHDCSPVAVAGVPGELGPLVQGLDRLLLRLRRALDAERDFASTAAHELRTPLAGALAQTQRLVAETAGAGAGDADGAANVADDGAVAAVHARARRIERSLHALQRLSARLLELARAEGAGTLVERSVDLAPTLARTLAPIAARPEVGARLAIDVEGAPLTSHLDPDAFSILLGNLVENALAHGASEAPVTVRRRGRCIDVDNAGRTLDAAELARLSRRHARAGAAGGAGLGLAIVNAIADGGGVAVDLISPCPGREGGVRARVRLEAPGSDAAPLRTCCPDGT